MKSVRTGLRSLGLRLGLDFRHRLVGLRVGLGLFLGGGFGRCVLLDAGLEETAGRDFDAGGADGGGLQAAAVHDEDGLGLERGAEGDVALDDETFAVDGIELDGRARGRCAAWSWEC